MRIGLIGHNSIEYIEKLFEIWNSGNSAVLIDYDTPPSVIRQIIDEYKIQHCYLEDQLCHLFDNSPQLDIKQYSIEYKMPCILPQSVRSRFNERYEENEAVVINSSGTTGKCKGISLSHRAINNNADSIIDYMKPKDSDCLYLNKKINHCSSLVGELLVALKSGADILVSQIIIPPRVAFQNINNFNISILCCNPTLIKFYADEAERTNSFPKSVNVVYTCGDMISEKQITRARNIFKCPVYNSYGQTECGPRITAQTEQCCHSNSAGKPIKNVAIKIDKSKEILVKTNALFSGYTNTDSHFAEWHNTGDLGYIDENGELFVLGRKDNMIVIGSHNIFPEVIEKTIIEKTEIIDCVVYKNETDLVCDYISKSDINQVNITKAIKSYLMPYEIPHIYRKIEKIPTNKNGKKVRITYKENDYGTR